ncbi:hypothetical protein JCM6882_003036 [Rhodosporidiobolus microsporus]
MFSNIIRTATPRLSPTLRSAARRHASTGGSSPHPIKESGKGLVGDAKTYSNSLVFGGLAVVGGVGLWWLNTDKPADPYPEHPKHQKGSEGLQKPLGK